MSYEDRSAVEERETERPKCRIVNAIARNEEQAQDNPMPQPAKLTLIRLVRIEAKFGSDIQHDVSMKVLREFLEAWKMNVESAHKGNKISINYGRESAQ